MRNYKFIGLTGPSGSGKSEFAKYFVSKGFYLINADALAKNALSKDSVCLKTVVSAFGEEILQADKTLNRKKLAEIAFSSKEKTQLLNDIVHPFVYLQVLKIAKTQIQSGCKKIIYDAPLLFESNGEILCDTIISVVSPYETRINRIINRDKIPKELAVKRLSQQQTNEFYAKNSDFTVINDSSIEKLYQKAEQIINTILLSK